MLDTRALVAADDAAIVHLLGECLRRIPIPQVDHATDGEAALALFLEHKHPLTVLRLNMPKMSGLDVLRRIRSIDPRAQVVIVAAHATKEQALEALNLHAFGLLEIPFPLEQLQTMLVEAYAQYRQLAGGVPAHQAEIAALRQVAHVQRYAWPDDARPPASCARLAGAHAFDVGCIGVVVTDPAQAARASAG